MVTNASRGQTMKACLWNQTLPSQPLTIFMPRRCKQTASEGRKTCHLWLSSTWSSKLWMYFAVAMTFTSTTAFSTSNIHTNLSPLLLESLCHLKWEWVKCQPVSRRCHDDAKSLKRAVTLGGCPCSSWVRGRWNASFVIFLFPPLHFSTVSALARSLWWGFLPLCSSERLPQVYLRSESSKGACAFMWTRICMTVFSSFFFAK